MPSFKTDEIELTETRLRPGKRETDEVALGRLGKKAVLKVIQVLNFQDHI